MFSGHKVVCYFIGYCVILYEVYTQSFSPAKENIGGHFESGSLAGTVKQNGVDYRADS